MPKPEGEQTVWHGRPTAGALVRLFALVLPLGLSVVATMAASRLVARPSGLGMVAWWVGLTAVGTVVAVVTERAARRLLPLAALLKLTLVFPDHAPQRYAIALRTGTTRQLQRRIEEARRDGLGDTPQAVAERVLELVAALSVHDRLTRGHCERVRAYVDLLAQEMRLDRDDASRLHWAGLIHDIGKIEVPAEILNKDGVPTEDEWVLIRRHPDAGARLAAPLAEWLGPWMSGVAEHHERWDGKGYPRGLAGEGIHLGGRIVAVADVFDVITAARSYKPPRSAAEARRELARCSGTQFDPAVVRAFLNISLGRLRFLIGPLSWVAQIPVLGQIPVAPAVGALGGALVVGAMTLGGILDPSTEVATDSHIAAAAPDSTADIAPDSEVTIPRDPGSTTTLLPGSSPAPDPQSPPRGSSPDTTVGPRPEVPPPTTTRPVGQPPATTPPATTPTTPPPTGSTTRLWLEAAAASGNTPSSPLLPLASTPPADAGLPNHDTDRDAFPGLLVQKSGDELAETDANKRQRWRRQLATDLVLAGPATLDLRVAVKDLETTKSGHVLAMIQDCTAAATGCTTIATGEITFSQAAFGGGFGSVQIDFGTIDHTFSAGRSLVLTVVTGDGAANSDDLWYAFGTATHPSRLTLTT